MSLEGERRRRARWDDLVPPCLAVEQAGWERRQIVLRAREAGVTVRVIAAQLGVSRERVRQLAAFGLRERKADLRPPIERYFLMALSMSAEHACRALRTRAHDLLP